MIGAFEQTLLTITVFVIMLGMGASLTERDFRYAMRRPQALVVGLLSQFGFMPALGFLMSLALGLPEPVVVGLLILSCMPGGATSNFFTYFSRGNLALSVSMTVASTVLGVILIPFILSLYASALNVEIPGNKIVGSLLLLLIPVGLGMALRRLNAAAGARVESAGAALAVFFIAFIVLSWIPRNIHFLRDTSAAVYVAAIMLGVAGFAFGYLFSRALRLHPRDARTVALETGIQNAPLAIAIIALSFASELQQPILAVVALYSLFVVITATLATLFFRWQHAGPEKL